MRLLAVENGRSVLRAANPGRPGMEATRANETMIRAVVVFFGRAAEAQCPSLPFLRPEATEGAFRGLSPGGAIR